MRRHMVGDGQEALAIVEAMMQGTVVNVGLRTNSFNPDQERDNRGRFTKDYRPAVSLLKEHLKAAKQLGHVGSGHDMIHPDDAKSIIRAVKRGLRAEPKESPGEAAIPAAQTPVTKEHRQEVRDAFDKLDAAHGRVNLVSVADLREALPHLSRERFDAVVHDMRKRNQMVGTGAEGRDALSHPEQHKRLMEGAMRERGIEGERVIAYLLTRNSGWDCVDNAEDQLRDTHGRFASLVEAGIPSHDSWHDLLAEDEYLYHATNLDNVGDMLEGHLEPHKPWHGTDQESWPDGSTNRRSYFSHSPSIAHDFAPAEGKPVLLRVKRPTARFRKESTGDHYTRDKIHSSQLEMHTEQGWKSLGS